MSYDLILMAKLPDKYAHLKSQIFIYVLFVAIGYIVCKFSIFLINSCQQFMISFDVCFIMNAEVRDVVRIDMLN